MNDSQSSSRLSREGTWIAILVLLGFSGLVVTMIASSSSSEQTWIRLAWVFSSVEAIAFAAAGAIFGSSVHRERAEKAEGRAAKNEEQAANGRALATQLIAEEEASGAEGFREAPIPGAQFSPSPTAPVDDTAARHARAARALFPDLG